MQQQAAQAYQQVAKSTVSPRDLEANLLIGAAGKLQNIKDNWAEHNSRQPIYDALTYNRKLWTVFVESVTSEDSPLPEPIRENIANIGIFVFKHTIDIEAAPEPQKLDALININREIAAGLRGS